MRSMSFLLFVALASVGVEAVSHAATPAEDLIAEGNQLRIAGRNQEALERFEKAHALSPSGRTLAQVGLAEASLHRWVDSETHIVAALASHDSRWIEASTNRKALEDALVVIRRHIGLVTVIGPDGADVTVGGRSVGRLPFQAPLHLPEGKVVMGGQADGRLPASTEVMVPGGGEITLRLELPLVAEAAPQPPPPPVAPAASVSPATQPDESPPPVLDRPGSVAGANASDGWGPILGYSLIAASAAAITMGIVWIAVGNDGACDAPAGTRCARVYDTRTAGFVALGAGVIAGTAGGLVLWHSRSGDARVGLMGGSAVALSGTF